MKRCLSYLLPRQSARRFGFTLIELLVVVAIIALLIAILLPSLGRARTNAKNTQCLAVLRGMGRAYYTYCTEFDGNSISYGSTTLATPGNLTTNPVRDVWGVEMWAEPGHSLLTDPVTKKYRRSNFNKNRLCPLALDVGKVGGTYEKYGTATSSWNYPSDEAANNDPGDVIMGSYTNSDLASDNPPFHSFWKQQDAVGKLGAGDYPDLGVFADCIWRDFEGRNNDNPLHSSYYTTVQQTLTGGPVSGTGLASGQSGIERCCIDRHQGAVNVVFKDGSARKVPLHELWSIHWNLTNTIRRDVQGFPSPEHFAGGY